MATVQALFGSAIRAAASGLSANEFYRSLQASGLGSRRSEVLKLFSQAKSLTVAAEAEAFANQLAIPTGHELGAWPVKDPGGVRQNVRILYRDRVTGDFKVTYWSTVTPNGITRQEAVNAAVDAYSANAEDYNQDLVGAFHSSAQRLVAKVV